MILLYDEKWSWKSIELLPILLHLFLLLHTWLDFLRMLDHGLPKCPTITHQNIDQIKFSPRFHPFKPWQSTSLHCLLNCVYPLPNWIPFNWKYFSSLLTTCRHLLQQTKEYLSSLGSMWSIFESSMFWLLVMHFSQVPTILLLKNWVGFSRRWFNLFHSRFL